MEQPLLRVCLLFLFQDLNSCFLDESLVFKVDEKPAFEIPLAKVAQAPTGGGKAVATLEFHPDDEKPVQLIEMRLYKPAAGEGGNADEMVEQFRQAVLKFVEGDATLPAVTLEQVSCLTPR
jgi:hypothetical protein